MKKNLLVIAFLAFSTTACAQIASTAVDAALEPSYTEAQASADMTKMVQTHASSQGAAAGDVKTNCSLVEGEEYACASFLQEHMVVLYGDCTEEGCKATGYDQVEPEDSKDEGDSVQ